MSHRIVLTPVSPASPSSNRLRHIAPPSVAPQAAGIAHSAAKAPFVAMASIALVAGVRGFDDQIDERASAKLLCKLPGRGLVDPHQGSLDHKPRLHAEIDRDLKSLHGVVATIGIAGIVGLADARDEVFELALMRDDGCERQEQEISAGHERRRQSIVARAERQIRGQCADADTAENAKVDQVIAAQLFYPGRPDRREASAHGRPAFHLHQVALTVSEADGFHAVIARQRPGEARRRILPAGEKTSALSGMIGSRSFAAQDAYPATSFGWARTGCMRGVWRLSSRERVAYIRARAHSRSGWESRGHRFSVAD